MNIETIIQWLTDHSGSIASVLGVLFTIAKAMSNDKANAAVAAIQNVVDMVAKIVSGIGSILKFVSDLLASLIKSDGILGRK